MYMHMLASSMTSHPGGLLRQLHATLARKTEISKIAIEAEISLYREGGKAKQCL